MKKTTMSYLMLRLDKKFWQKVQHLAIDMNMNVKGLILHLLENELERQGKNANKK